MMIVLIGGSINAGKTTVAKKLKEIIGNAALLEIDMLRGFIPHVPLEDAIPINLENAACLIRNFTNHHLDVIMPYPLSKSDYDFLVQNLKDTNQKIFAFILNPSLETALRNRGERELDGWERERIRYHYSIGINDPGFGETIDNTNQTPDETVLEIISRLKNAPS